MVRTGLGTEPVSGQLASTKKKKEYKVTNRLQEGKRPLYALAFNFIDAAYFNIFATAGGNRVRHFHFSKFLCNNVEENA